MTACKICADNSTEGKLFRAREMMFGLRDEFDYFQCAACGTVQLASLPHDLSRYYPARYGPHAMTSEPARSQTFSFKEFLCDRLIRHELGERTLLGHALQLRFPHGLAPAWLRFLGDRARREMRILDVGCGTGELLLWMQYWGFKSLKGFDPFLAKPGRFGRVELMRTTIDRIMGEFDLVMLHHVFEHVSDPHTMLLQARQRLAPDGILLLRIPLAGSYACHCYRENWVQLDAPRHLFLYTPSSLEMLARKLDLDLTDVVFDSDAFQFYGSEQYLRDIPLHDPRSVWHSPPFGPFSQAEMKTFSKRARQLNSQGTGDQASFFFRAR